MATDPSFASTPIVGAALLGSAETSLTVPTNSSTIVTGGSSGTKIERIVVHAATTSLTPTTFAGLVYLFLYDGSTYNIVDTIEVTAVTASTTVKPFKFEKPYLDLVVPNGWTLEASQSIADNANLLKVTALGGNG